MFRKARSHLNYCSQTSKGMRLHVCIISVCDCDRDLKHTIRLKMTFPQYRIGMMTSEVSRSIQTSQCELGNMQKRPSHQMPEIGKMYDREKCIISANRTTLLGVFGQIYHRFLLALYKK
jgi:hypothetical protein